MKNLTDTHLFWPNVLDLEPIGDPEDGKFVALVTTPILIEKYAETLPNGAKRFGYSARSTDGRLLAQSGTRVTVQAVKAGMGDEARFDIEAVRAICREISGVPSMKMELWAEAFQAMLDRSGLRADPLPAITNRARSPLPPCDPDDLDEDVTNRRNDVSQKP